MCSRKIQCSLLFWDMNLKWLTEMYADLLDFDEDLKGEDMLLDLYTETLMSIKQMAYSKQDVDIELKQTAIWLLPNMNKMCDCKIML